MTKQVYHGSNLGITFTIALRVPLTVLSLGVGCISNLRLTLAFKKKCILIGIVALYIVSACTCDNVVNGSNDMIGCHTSADIVCQGRRVHPAVWLEWRVTSCFLLGRRASVLPTLNSHLCYIRFLKIKLMIMPSIL